MDRLDVAVIGGGAAGIAAARSLIERGKSVLLIEALPRLGGRARTETLNGVPVDFGCEWLHSAERNPLTALAERNGFIVDRGESAWQKQSPNLIYVAEDRQRAWNSYERFVQKLHDEPPPSDRAADVFAEGDPCRGYVDALSSFINGTETDNLSARDFLTYDDAASDNNWRLERGYGTLISKLGADVPASIETSVTRISHGREVELETSRGTIRAKAAIVTVSTTVLASGAIRFSPAIDDHFHAASLLPLGIADKVFLSMADPQAIPAETHFIGRLDRAGTASHYIRPFGRPVIECYLGGKLARELENAGSSAAESFVLGELRELLGSDVVRGFKFAAFTRWGHEPTIGGSYSHALPGHAAARSALAKPVSERLCFAGEACSPRDFSTALGAWQSGITAADWIACNL
ncbi:MAG: NAD(P)/FAD-dependent oxidoreductase [Hyphomicrobium sp.]|uniref:flavin monoamine oxidase family protein n=1 Tax=Hyphomicrobium sp. TaxID=82 RepID=UPI0039E3F1B1